MTEFGAEALPAMADAAPDQKGGYASQAFHAGRTIALLNRLPFMSGGIYWTLREFEIYPGWGGGAPRSSSANGPTTRQHHGILPSGELCGTRTPPRRSMRQ